MSREDYGLGSADSADNTYRRRMSGKPQKTQRGNAMDRVPAYVRIWRIIKPLAVIIVSLAIVALGLYFAYNKVYHDYISPVDAESSEEIEIVIESGSTLTKISELLEEKGIIRNAKVFKYYVDFSDMSSKIKAGTFRARCL